MFLSFKNIVETSWLKVMEFSLALFKAVIVTPALNYFIYLII